MTKGFLVEGEYLMKRMYRLLCIGCIPILYAAEKTKAMSTITRRPVPLTVGHMLAQIPLATTESLAQELKEIRVQLAGNESRLLVLEWNESVLKKEQRALHELLINALCVCFCCRKTCLAKVHNA